MGLSPVSKKKDRKAVTEHCAGGKPETVSNFTETLTDYRGKDEFGLWQLHFSWPHTCSVSHSESLRPLASACLLVTGVPQGVRTPSLPLSVLSLLFSSRTFSLPWNFHSFPHLVVLHPSLVSSLHCLSALSCALGPQYLSCHSLDDLVISFSPLPPFLVIGWGIAEEFFGWKQCLPKQVSFPGPLCVPLCMELNVTSETATLHSLSLSLSLPLFPSPSFSRILHILCALEQCHSLNLITN